MANPISNIPILLFPLKLETRFVKDELWIRAFPDEAFLQSHDPTLTQEEKKDALVFKQLTSEEQKRAAWEELVSKYGVYRSSWLVQISNEDLELLTASAKEKEEEPSFYFKWLPDRLVFYIYKEGDQQPTYKGDGSLIDHDGLTVLEEGDAWLQDFKKALDAGMGIKIKINPADTKFERIIVSGFRHDSDPLVPAQGLADLFDNHKYTEGFSFLKYGTPTNNTENATSGHSAREEFEVADSFEYAVKGLPLEPIERDTTVLDIHSMTAGKYLARGLGFETNQLKGVRHADLKPAMLNELYQKASWFALGAQPLFMLFGNQLGNETLEALWQHYSKYVKCRGLYTALKIGKQPYGILPVMNISNVFLPENKDILESDALFDKMMVILAKLKKRWLLMTQGKDNQVPRLEGQEGIEDILKILGMQEGSSRYQIRAMEYRFFKSKMYDLLHNRPQSITLLKFLEGLGSDYETVHENIASLSDVFDLDDKNLSETFDQFLRAPLLGFTEGDVNLIGFQDGKSVVMDNQGNTIPPENQKDTQFSFTQEDLGNFQDFITALQNQKENELIQYRGDLSVFTDLFLRSYTNACQLYYREIVFDLTVSEISLSGPTYTVGSLVKAEGSAVIRGDAVVLILDSKTKPIEIKAPFDGKIIKMLVSENEKITPGIPLFTLIDETKYNEIKSAFITLGQELITASNGIVEINDRIVAQEKAIGEAIDLNSYRLDAWITSLAASRLDEIRSKPKYEKGIYFGAYGWINGLEKDQTPVDATTLTDIYREDGGIIHTYGAAQTVASTVFKNSFLSHRDEGQSNPFTINLSSDRLQKSEFVLEGIRQGQQLEGLLGYQLERELHENGLHNEIYALREAYPLYENTAGNTTGFVNLSVIDGLKAIKNKENLPNNLKQVKKHIEKLEDTMDASLDTLFYEAGYQVTQGNLSQAAAALAATKGELEPPKIESLKTKIPGTGISHKLGLIFPMVTESYPMANSRAFAEPHLEKWLETVIGPMERLGCQVEIHNPGDKSLIENIALTLADLKIGYLDFLYVSEEPVSDGTSELELRIWNAAREKKQDLPEDSTYNINDQGPESGPSLIQAIELARYTKKLLEKCRSLKSDDLTLENETIRYDRNTLDAIKKDRLEPLIDHLKGLLQSDLTQKSALVFLSTLDFESAKRFFLEGTPIALDMLKSAIGKKLTLAETLLSQYTVELPFQNAFDHLQQTAKILFGDTFILLPPALGSENFVRVVKEDAPQLLVGNPSDNSVGQVWGQERIEDWIQGVAQVHENTELFEDWCMINTAWNEKIGLSDSYFYRIVQGPTLSKFPWVALSKQEIDLVLDKQYASNPIYTDVNGDTYPLPDGSYYPENSESTILYAPEQINLEKAVHGLVIEEFSEHIPDKKMDTGLSFNYNTPDNEPPQAILLAIHPKAAQDSEFFWSEDDLRDILYDTIDLYKIRMVDLEALQEYGYFLPMTYWFNLPGNK